LGNAYVKRRPLIDTGNLGPPVLYIPVRFNLRRAFDEYKAQQLRAARRKNRR